MFEFFESDIFTIGLEVAFLAFIGYDLKKYLATKKREYLLNITLALGFFVYAAIPFYNKYVTWNDADKMALQTLCEKDHDTKLCECLSDVIEKEYSFASYETVFESKELKSFTDETLKECREG